MLAVAAQTGTDLCPLRDAAEEAFGGRVLRESGQELSDVNEIHLQEHFLFQFFNTTKKLG